MVRVLETRKARPAPPACAHPAVSHPAVSRPVSQSMHRQRALIQQHQRIFNPALRTASVYSSSGLPSSNATVSQPSTLPPILAHPAASSRPATPLHPKQSSTLPPARPTPPACAHPAASSPTTPPIPILHSSIRPSSFASVRSFSCQSPTTTAA